jgi:hypothetical protein
MDLRIWMLPVLGFLSLAVYDWNLQQLYAYQGLVPVDAGLDWWFVFVVWMILTATVVPPRIRQPSDLFLLFYSVACLMWGGVLWGATGFLSMEEALLLLGLLYFPALCIRLARFWLLKSATTLILPIQLFERRHLYLPLTLLLAVGAFAALVAIGSGDFSTDTTYDRRLAGRAALGDQVLAGYAIGMTVNGIAPLMAFTAGWRRSPALFAISIAFVVLMFWLLGMKSPLVNVLTLGGIGFLLRDRRFDRWLVPLLLGCMIVLFAYVAREAATGSYSALADYVVRRVALVQPQVQSYYLDHWLTLDWSHRLKGAPFEPHTDLTFMIGHKYLHNAAANANVNGFVYALVRGGPVGYGMSVLVVVGFCLAVDAMFENSSAIEFVGLAGLYGILVSEQNYATALVSSGVALCLALVILFSYPSRRRRALPRTGIG